MACLAADMYSDVTSSRQLCMIDLYASPVMLQLRRHKQESLVQTRLSAHAGYIVSQILSLV